MRNSTLRRHCLFVLLLCLTNCAVQGPQPPEEQLHVGHIFPTLRLADQFDRVQQLGNESSRILIAFDMETAKRSNEWLASQPEDFLMLKQLYYVNDISKMPRLITRLFAKPKMQRYRFPILLNTDEEALRSLPRTEGKLSFVEIGDDGIIRRMNTLDSLEALDEPEGQ